MDSDRLWVGYTRPHSITYYLRTELSKYITVFQEETLGEVGFFTGGVRRVARVDFGEGK